MSAHNGIVPICVQIMKFTCRCAWSTQRVIFVAILARVVANPSQFFAAFDSLVVLTAHSDVYISRTGDFRTDDNNDRRSTIYTLPLTHARGVRVMLSYASGAEATPTRRHYAVKIPLGDSAFTQLAQDFTVNGLFMLYIT